VGGGVSLFSQGLKRALFFHSTGRWVFTSLATGGAVWVVMEGKRKSGLMEGGGIEKGSQGEEMQINLGKGAWVNGIKKAKICPREAEEKNARGEESQCSVVRVKNG